MALYNKFADTPERLKLEGQEITVKFVRNGDGTATIKWNIPNISGCSVEDLAYDGIVITVDTKPANYLTTSPKDGTYYTGDPTFDADLHTGDSIDTAKVVGAFYHDTTTTELMVTDVADKTPYYVSAYAVSQVAEYHREGVHAYSLATGQKEETKAIDEAPAYHDIKVDTPDGITVNARTGLDLTKKYTLKLEIDGECYEFTDLLGSDMQTYKAMAETINKRLDMLVDPLLGPLYPNEGQYQVVVTDEIVYVWDGTQNVEEDSIFLPVDPAVPVLGTYWYVPSTGVLNVRESGGWATVSTVIAFPIDPSNPTDGTIWLDKVYESNGNIDPNNTSGWEWEDGTWCKRNTIVSERNPLLPPVLTSGHFWYNETDGTVNRWNPELRRWEEVDPIVWDTDPNTIADGNYWYNSTDGLVYIRIASAWSETTNIRYEERNSEGDLDNPVANHYWFIPSEQRLFQRDATNTSWTEINVIISALDPANRVSCDTWWDVTVGTDTIFVWDAVNSEWDSVTSFTQSVDDPSGPPMLPAGTLWYQPSTDTLQSITGVNCTNVTFICSPYDPTSLPVGVVWHDTTNDTWFVWDGTQFTAITVIENENDPYDVADGKLWFDTTTSLLYLRVSGAWVPQTYSTSSLAPKIGTFFYDTIDEKLLQWDGTKWVEGCGLAEVELMFNREVCLDDLTDVNTDLFSPYNDNDRFGRDIIRFKTCGTGCDHSIEVDSNSTTLVNLQHPLIYYSSVVGRSKNEAGPTHAELGVGTDGTPDERRKLQDQIRAALGTIGVEVELTKQQLDECIDNALLMVRKYSSYAYQHVLFFLDVYPNQQKYVLTNKCVGFNKIIQINACHRMRTGFLGASHGTFGGYDIYGYAALQQLYQLGSFDMLSYHLVSSYLEDLQYLFADQLVYTFYEDNRTLSFHQVFYRQERLLLDAHIELPEQQLMTNRYLSLWIKKWAISEAKMILSQVRGKFQSLPGPNGSTVLNSQELITQAENEKAELREELFDRSMQDHNADVGSQFFIG